TRHAHPLPPHQHDRRRSANLSDGLGPQGESQHAGEQEHADDRQNGLGSHVPSSSATRKTRDGTRSLRTVNETLVSPISPSYHRWVASAAPANRWLLLVHQLPPKPSYARVKVWRRLQGLGAVALKNAVYVLPNLDATREDFEWLAREIHELGGSATACEARLVQGSDDHEIEELFHAARGADYQALLKDAQQVRTSLRSTRSRKAPTPEQQADVAALRRRFAAAHALDFFGAFNREPAAR